MRDYKERYRKLLFKDECGDTFLFLGKGEIYGSPLSGCLRLTTFSSGVADRMRKEGWVVREDSTDDPLWMMDFKEEKLDEVVKTFTKGRVQRYRKTSKAFLGAEKSLLHRIFSLNQGNGAAFCGKAALQGV